MQAISRRTKFLIFTLVYISGSLAFEFSRFDKNLYALIFSLIILLLNLLALYPGYRVKDLFYISFEPLVLTISTLYGLLFFPNLNLFFKLGLVFVSAVLLYISTLTNNLTIAEKTEDLSLPLFRVGLIWTQILLILQSIPLVTIVYKLNLPFYIQSLLILVYFVCASLSYLHTFLLTKKGEEVSKGEQIVLLLQMSFMPLAGSLATSFIPAETFLRATFITSLFMGMVGYTRNFLDNALTKRLIIQYSLIILFFLIVLILFKN
jgi:hypothetical protein